ncbi:hypothetical protein JKF63_07033 [Porcisia hertigi]|uniref:Uncharacterized protein n=1 Tax=Porcisia hertigi TaxID=2761500 RepID=A0A836IPB2_9TRYP|nr:hypothetical protein JKF63_07033 [Porcisia hertigi]
MFTTEDPQELVVLKTVAFQHATQSLCSRVSAPEAHTTWPPCAASQSRPRQDGRGQMREALHINRSGKPSIPSTTARSAPRFTFKLPVSPAAGRPSAITADDGCCTVSPHSHAARVALEESLWHHEEALRSWANEPAQHVPPGMRDAIGVGVESDVPLSFVDQAGQETLQWHTTRLRLHGQPSADMLSPRVAALTQPHCRVLAQGSVAGIGLPAAVISKRTATAGATVPSKMASPQNAGHGEAPEGLLENSRSEHGYVASTSLSSPAPQPRRDSERSVHLRHTAALALGAPDVLFQDMQPSPYQLPLRMRLSAPAPALPPASTAATSPSPAADATRRTFLDEQAKRYAEWRNRQAAVLHQLAPDMWGRALPHCAALDRQPHVMDCGLRTHTSYVRRSQYDSGVVIV